MSVTDSLWLTIGTCLCLAFSSEQQPSGSPQEKPIRNVPLFVDYMKQPDTLSELAGDCDLVVLGRVANIRFMLGEKSPYTRIMFTVERVVKGEKPAAGFLLVRSEGYDIDRGDRIDRVQEVNVPRFEAAGQYLLFLQKSRRSDDYETAWGPSGRFRVENGFAHVLAKGYLQYDGLPLGDVIRAVEGR